MTTCRNSPASLCELLEANRLRVSDVGLIRLSNHLNLNPIELCILHSPRGQHAEIGQIVQRENTSRGPPGCFHAEEIRALHVVDDDRRPLVGCFVSNFYVREFQILRVPDEEAMRGKFWAKHVRIWIF